jgi:hypothetical protein
MIITVSINKVTSGDKRLQNIPIYIIFFLKFFPKQHRETWNHTFFINYFIDQYERGKRDYAYGFGNNIRIFSLSVSVWKEMSELSIFRVSKAIEINPRFSDACTERAFIYYAKKEHDKDWENVHRA